MNKKILLLLMLFFPSAHATEYLSPRTLSLGGAGRAAPMLNDGIYMNPSYSSFVPSYSISGGYTWFDQGRNYNASIQDSRTEMFQAGVGFTRREQNAAVNIGASKQAIQNLGVGLGAKIIIDDRTHNTTMDTIFSTSFIATPWFYSSLVIDNLFQSEAAKAHQLYRTFYLGTKFTALDVVQIYFDPFYSPAYAAGNKAGYSAALEFSLLADFFLRMGRFHDSDIPYLNTHGSGLGLGIGWLGPRITFDYAFHRVTQTDSGLPLTTAHAASVTVYF